MAQDALSFLNGVARNLLTLEVNTILKDNMTVEPMPSIPHALLDIAGEYSRKLNQFGVNVEMFLLQADGKGGAKPEASELPDMLRREGILWLIPNTNRLNTDLLFVNVDTFDRLRWAAKAAGLDGGGPPAFLSQSDLIIAERICNNCDALKGVIGRVPEFSEKALNRAMLIGEFPDGGGELSRSLTNTDYLTIRKIWEVGTEDVVAQTVIQIDADVVTRLREHQLDRSGMPTLLKVHELGIDVSMKSWHHLFAIVQDIASGALDLFRSK